VVAVYFGLTFLEPDEEVKDALYNDLLPLRPASEKFEKFTEYIPSRNDDAKYPHLI